MYICIIYTLIRCYRCINAAMEAPATHAEPAIHFTQAAPAPPPEGVTWSVLRGAPAIHLIKAAPALPTAGVKRLAPKGVPRCHAILGLTRQDLLLLQIQNHSMPLALAAGAAESNSTWRGTCPYARRNQGTASTQCPHAISNPRAQLSSKAPAPAYPTS